MSCQDIIVSKSELSGCTLLSQKLSGQDVQNCLKKESCQNVHYCLQKWIVSQDVHNCLKKLSGFTELSLAVSCQDVKYCLQKWVVRMYTSNCLKKWDVRMYIIVFKVRGQDVQLYITVFKVSCQYVQNYLQSKISGCT